MGLLGKLEEVDALHKKPSAHFIKHIRHHRGKIQAVVKTTKEPRKLKPQTTKERDWVKTGVEGFDALFEKGIPNGSAVLVAGGAGTGKTIFCLQAASYAASRGEQVVYISLEESEQRLRQHMRDFNLKPDELEKRGVLLIKRIDPFEISRNVEALLAKARGELKMDIFELTELFPKNFRPKLIIIDSLTALQAAFREVEESYRIYIEQLFRHFEKLGVTSMLISETEQVPTKFSPSGVEEFLADCVVVLYGIRRGDIRENAIEVLKLRGGRHEKKIVAMRIETGKGVIVYPEQEVIGGVEGNA